VSLLATVREVMGAWPQSLEDRDGVVVPTHCLYPSNAVVRVHVAGGSTTFRVHDGGGAIDELEASGARNPNDMHIVRSAARAQGLDVTLEGTIISPFVELPQLAGTIVLVANASKEAAHSLISKSRGLPKRDFREALATLIDLERAQGRFVEVLHRRVVVGASNKPHRFDFDIALSGTRRLLLDAVIREPFSINAVLVANLDVKEAELPNTIQRIVYDDDDQWDAADLSLLGLGATVVGLSRLRPVLERMTA
jgi:hypothetical protein